MIGTSQFALFRYRKKRSIETSFRLHFDIDAIANKVMCSFRAVGGAILDSLHFKLKIIINGFTQIGTLLILIRTY